MKKEKDITPFEKSQRLASFLAKDYCGRFLTLLIKYRDVSASEAASRLDIHVKTAQDFLEGLFDAGILKRREAVEGKRPYYRYSLKEKTIRIFFDLDDLYNPSHVQSVPSWRVKERKNSGALFKEGRGEKISSVTVFEGRGRSRRERRYNLTDCQGRFLFHLPFPTEPPSPLMEILKKASLQEGCFPEIMDLVDILSRHNIIEKKP